MFLCPDPSADESLQEAKQAELNGVLADWEARYKTAHATLGTSGPFFLGTEPSVADLAILPLLVRFNVLLQVGGSCFTAGQLTHRMLLPWQGPRCPFLSPPSMCSQVPALAAVRYSPG